MSDLLDRIKGTTKPTQSGSSSLLARIKGEAEPKPSEPRDPMMDTKPVAAGSKMTLADLPGATPEEAARLKAQDAKVKTYAEIHGYGLDHYMEQGARSLVNAVPDVLAAPFDLIDRVAGGGEGLSGAGQFGSAIRSLKREDLPDMEKIPEGRFAQQLGGGLGMVGTTVAAPELMGLKGPQAVTLATSLGAAPVAVGNYQRVLEKTGDKDLAADAMLKGFGVAMVGGVLPLGRILKRINGETNGAFVEALGDAAVFGSAGTGQEYVNNAILEHATGEELNTLSHLAETGGMNALIGVLTSAAGHAIAKRPAVGKPKDTPPEPQDAPKAEPTVQGAETPSVQPGTVQASTEPASVEPKAPSAEPEATFPVMNRRGFDPETDRSVGGQREGVPIESAPPTPDPVLSRITETTDADLGAAEADPLNYPESRKWFSDSALENVNLETQNEASRTTLVKMRIKDFLDLAEAGEDPDKAQTVLDLVSSGTKFNSVPFLLMDNNGDGTARVAGHEGRHRARAMLAAGEEFMPVRLTSREGGRGPAVRWGRQVDGGREQVSPFPSKLISEDGSFSTDTPDSTIFPRNRPKALPPTIEDASAQPDKAAGVGDKPPEAQKPPMTGEGDPVSPANATMERDLARLGFEPPPENAGRTFADKWAEAKRIVADDPTAGKKLLADLEATQRPPRGVENGILAHEITRLTNEYEAALKAYNENPTEANKATKNVAEIDYTRASEILKRTGGESSDSLNFRRFLVNRDFSLARMTEVVRAKQDGEPLSSEQEAKLIDIRKRLDEFEAKMKELDERTKGEAFDKVTAKLQKRVDSTAKPKPGVVRIYIHNKAEEARARFKSGNVARSFESVISDAAWIGADYIAQGVSEFTAWSKAMALEIGERAEPEMRKLFAESQRAASQGQLDAFSERATKRFKEGRGFGDIPSAIARHFIEQGVKGRDPLIDAVHAELRKIDPTLTREGARDAISGYGKTTTPSQEESAKVLRGLKGEMQQLAKLDALAKKQVPLKTGPQRGEPTAEARSLAKKVREQMKQLGLKAMGAADHLKTQLESTKTRLRNQIEDLTREIERRELDVETPRTPASDAEVEALRTQLSDVRKQHEDIFGKPGMTDEQRAKAALEATKKSLAEYERRVRENDTSPRPEKQGPPTPETARIQAEREALVARRDALKAQYDEMVAAQQPPKPERKLTTAEERELERLQNRQDDLLIRLDSGDLSPKQRGKATVDTEAVAKARAEVKALSEQIDAARKLANPPMTNEQRAIMSAITRSKNRTARLKEKMMYGDFSVREKKPPVTSPEIEAQQAEGARIERDYEILKRKAELSRRSRARIVQDTLIKWRRAFVLSSPSTLAKLTAAGAERMIFTPLEEAIGAGIGKAIPKVAEQAPRQGGISPQAEASALTQGFVKGMKDARDIMKTGASDLDAINDKSHMDLPKSALDFFGHLHAALKATTKRNEFIRSFQKRTEFAIRQGVDVRDPLVQTRIASEAYKDANASIFMQDNIVVDAYKRALSALEAKNKETGNPSPIGEAGATAARVMLPIIKVPTNVVAETFAYVFGGLHGTAELANAYRKGIDTLQPHEADAIMRHLKKGSLGAAVLALGYFGAGSIGGYYSRDKRDPNDPKFGSIRVFGVNVPSLLIHNPLLEVLQVGATMRRVADSMHKGERKGIADGAIAAAMGVAEQVPFVRETMDTSKALDAVKQGQGSDALGGVAGDMVAPGGLSWLARQFDKDSSGETVKRKPRGFVQTVEAGIPFLRNTLPTK